MNLKSTNLHLFNGDKVHKTWHNCARARFLSKIDGLNVQPVESNMEFQRMEFHYMVSFGLKDNH